MYFLCVSLQRLQYLICKRYIMLKELFGFLMSH